MNRNRGPAPNQASSSAKKTTSSGDVAIFRGSRSSTIGVELELQILDRETGDLAPGAVRLLKAGAEESIPGLSAEFMQSMVEVKTGVCQNVAEAREELVKSLRPLCRVAEAHGYQIALGATHPTHRATANAIYPGERYDQILDRLAWVGYQWVAFGLHVHVGVPSGDVAMGAISMLVQYLPHLLALSSNSPYWQGVDTGLASARSALYRMIPHSGVPRHFRSWKEFRTFYRVMTGCKAIHSLKDIYWDIRPRPDFGTIEFRICDMPATVSQACGLAALSRALVEYAQQLMTEHPKLLRGDRRRHWIAIENKWLATRYGLEGPYIRTTGGKRRLLRQEVAELFARLKPIATNNGDAEFFDAFGSIEEFETGAQRQRRLYQADGWPAVVSDMRQRFQEDLNAISS